MPVLYDAAMRSDPLHVLEHASFLVTAVLFWSVIFDNEADRFKRVGLVFATMLQSGALGALIAFASEPLYQWHIGRTPGGYDVLGQQQVAGAIMWIPPGVVYLGVMLGLLWKALTTLDAAEQS
jgi:putative membrane protein